MRKNAPHEVAQALLRIQDKHKELRFLLAGSTDKFERIAELATEIRDEASVIRLWAFNESGY